MKLITASCIALVLTATAASADTWTGAYGNTIVSTYSNGNVVKVYVEPNHTYSLVLGNGQKLSGTWADGGGQSCFTVTSPPPAPGATPTCFALKEYKVGDSFSGQDANGSFHGVINPGR
ncbi:MAG TPA: hypothetical protein VGG48_02435 [Rhizomicrobium sp.]|jgi:hypothetical protein